MAQPQPRVAVVGTQFVLPHPLPLTIVRKVKTLSTKLAVTDAYGNLWFKIKGKLVNFFDRLVLVDAGDHPVLSFQKKPMSAHRRWQVFKGDSSDNKNLLFSVKQSCVIQCKTSLDVFLPNNKWETACDFKVKGDWLEKSCTICAGESSTILAEMSKKHSVQNVVLGKETFMITVSPNVDYAFIVALVVILDEINDDKHDDSE